MKDSQTDAEPTSGPWAFKQQNLTIVSKKRGEIVRTLPLSGMHSLSDQRIANARLIAAAGTAAQEAKEMGYDPQEAVEALPKALQAARKAIIDLQEAHTSGPPEDSAEAAAQAASHRLKVFMAEAGADEAMIPGDASVALASADDKEDNE